jgi:hypothetical protein
MKIENLKYIKIETTWDEKPCYCYIRGDYYKLYCANKPHIYNWEYMLNADYAIKDRFGNNLPPEFIER